MTMPTPETWSNLAPAWWQVGPTWANVFEQAPPWKPEPTVTIGGVSFTGQTVDSVRIERGRRTPYEVPRAGYASFQLRDVGDMAEIRVGQEVVITMNNTSGAPTTIFTGLLSDWSASTVATRGDPVVRYRVQAVGPLALLNRRVTFFDGRPPENDGERVLAAVRGAETTWEEVSFSLRWQDAEGTWETFAGIDTSLINDGVFALAALGGSDSGYNALQVAQEAGFSGEGTLFESADGRIGYANADRRFANERAGFIDVPASQLSVEGLGWRSELAEITNRVTLEYDGGAVVSDDPFSIVEFGLYERQISTRLLNLNNARARARDFVSRHSTPLEVIEELRFNLFAVDGFLRDVLFDADVNAAIRVSDIPRRVGFRLFEGFVEGLTLNVGEFSASLTLNVSDKTLSVASRRWGQIDPTWTWSDLIPSEWRNAEYLLVNFPPLGQTGNPFRPDPDP